MRPPGAILAPGESLIATGTNFFSQPSLLPVIVFYSLYLNGVFFCVRIWLVFKFVEHPESNEKPLLEQKSKLKFKIMSLTVKGPMDYVPEMVCLCSNSFKMSSRLFLANFVCIEIPRSFGLKLQKFSF